MSNNDVHQVKVHEPIELIKVTRDQDTKQTVLPGIYQVKEIPNPVGRKHPWVVLVRREILGICHLSFEEMATRGLVEYL